MTAIRIRGVIGIRIGIDARVMAVVAAGGGRLTRVPVVVRAVDLLRGSRRRVAVITNRGVV